MWAPDRALGLSGQCTLSLIVLWVPAREGDYADALRRGNDVALYCTESTGAVSPSLDTVLRRLGKLSSVEGTLDHTVYGASPSSPHDFYTHHLARHSAAVVLQDATTLLNAAAALGYSLTLA